VDTERDCRDRAASTPPRVGPVGPVDDSGGTPMPRPGAMCGVRPNGTGSTGLPSRRTGDVRPAETDDVSPWRVLRLEPRCGGRLGIAVVACLFRACLFRRLYRCMSLPTLTPEVHPPA
jgi:hypothetical protein